MKYIRIFIALLTVILFPLCTTHRNYGKLIIKITPQSQGVPYYTFGTIRISSDLGYCYLIEGQQPRSFYCDSIGNRREIVDSIPYGKYCISFNNIFEENTSIEFVVKDTLSEITLDFLMYNVNENENIDSFIDKLNQKDSLKITCQSNFCISGPLNYYPLIVWKNNNQIYYKLMDSTRIMNDVQVTALRNFEKILKKIEKSKFHSSSSDIYNIIVNKDTAKYIDRTSSWFGYQTLFKEMNK